LEFANLLRKSNPPNLRYKMTRHSLNVPFTTKLRSIQKINRSVKMVLAAHYSGVAVSRQSATFFITLPA
jgi:hypothetical protein